MVISCRESWCSHAEQFHCEIPGPYHALLEFKSRRLLAISSYFPT